MKLDPLAYKIYKSSLIKKKSELMMDQRLNTEELKL